MSIEQFLQEVNIAHTVNCIENLVYLMIGPNFK